MHRAIPRSFSRPQLIQARPLAFLREKWKVNQYIELQWPEYDAVILNCPHCNMPLATTKTHKIVSLEPLTIETPIGREYSRAKGIATKAREQEEAVVFLVTDGK
jgi:hypothetical protein